MKMLVQPDDGVQLLLKGISNAKHSIQIVIFRFDQREIERALANAVSRGVSVHALIAHTNRAGEGNLRRLEMRLLAAGVTVARSADDYIRYHGKLMLIDRRELYLLAFNWTYTDIEHSRSFGVIARSPALIEEAERLFDADVKRNPFETASPNFVVSPVNARKLLSAFISGAKKELIIYDPKVSDTSMIALLNERCRAGVDIKVLGRMAPKLDAVAVRKLSIRLHTRTMVRDGNLAFIGSQSLRAAELDARREVGIIFRDRTAVAALMRTFAADWELAEQAALQADMEAPASKVARKVAKRLAKDLPEIAPVLNGAVKEIVGDAVTVEFKAEEIEGAVMGAVKDAVREVVRDLVQEAVENDEGRGHQAGPPV